MEGIPGDIPLPDQDDLRPPGEIPLPSSYSEEITLPRDQSTEKDVHVLFQPPRDHVPPPPQVCRVYIKRNNLRRSVYFFATPLLGVPLDTGSCPSVEVD